MRHHKGNWIKKTGEADAVVVASATALAEAVPDASLRPAGSVVSLGEEIELGAFAEDLVAAGYSLELMQGSQVGTPGNPIGGDMAFAGSQVSLSGQIVRNVYMAGEGLELNGTVGGTIKAYVGGPNAEVLPINTIPGLNSAPTIAGGLTFGSEARINGLLEYTSPEESEIPASVISSENINFHQKSFTWNRTRPVHKVSALDRATGWFLNQFPVKSL